MAGAKCGCFVISRYFEIITLKTKKTNLNQQLCRLFPRERQVSTLSIQSWKLGGPLETTSKTWAQRRETWCKKLKICPLQKERQWTFLRTFRSQCAKQISTCFILQRGEFLLLDNTIQTIAASKRGSDLCWRCDAAASSASFPSPVLPPRSQAPGWRRASWKSRTPAVSLPLRIRREFRGNAERSCDQRWQVGGSEASLKRGGTKT